MPRNARTGYRRRRKAYRRKTTMRRRLSRTTRRKTTLKKPFTKTKHQFSSKGFKHVFRDKYTLDAGPIPVRVAGYTSGTLLSTRFFKPFISGSAVAGWQNLGANGPGLRTRFIYGRIFFALNDLYDTEATIRDTFNTCKVNRVTLKFNFPDQAASTTNTDFPVTMWVNHGDKNRLALVANAGYGGPVGFPSNDSSVDAMLERPGWKQYVVKRNNVVTVSFTPSTVWMKDIINHFGTEENRLYLGKSKYLNNAYENRALGFLGPTIVFRTNDPGVNDHAAGQNFVATPFLEYTTVDVMASVSWKDIDFKSHDKGEDLDQ